MPAIPALMDAMVLHAPGAPLTLERLPVPRPASGQVLIRVRACGVCRTDLHVFDGDLPHPKLPLILGHEIVGEVVAAGAGVAVVVGATFAGVATAVIVVEGRTPTRPAGGAPASLPPGRTSSQTAKTVEISSASSEPRYTRDEGSALNGSMHRSHSVSPWSSQYRAPQRAHS